MQEAWNEFMRLGIVHFMAFPQCLQGEGPILETLYKIVIDDFFTAVEISRVKDAELRKKVKRLLESSGLRITYGAQPQILSEKLNLNSLNSDERQKAVHAVKERIDEAAFLGAGEVAVLSGPDPGEEKREKAKDALVDAMIQLSKYAKEKNLKLALETFDRDIDKKCLLGPSLEAAEVASRVREECDNFGLLLDLSHFPLQHETTTTALINAKEYLLHAHLGNCVVKDKNHPAYGDQHPRFGIEGGENGVEHLREFLRILFQIGFLRKESRYASRPIVSFGVKPLPGEYSEAVIANAKRTFKEAWEGLEIK